jgi:hypothetical protein
MFRDLPEYLRAGDLLVLNDSRVLPARLFAARAGRAETIEVLLVEEVRRIPKKGKHGDSSGTGEQEAGPVVWRALGEAGAEGESGGEAGVPWGGERAKYGDSSLRSE